MFIETGFGRNLDIMHRLMDTAVLRHNVIANNMANSETPNFKRSEVNFEKELLRRLELERNGKYTLDFDRAKECRFAFQDPEPYSTLKPIRSLDYLSQADNNGNNVNYTTVPEGNTFGTSDDTGNSGVESDWGAVLMDCDISGTLWSDVNTHVVVSKSRRGLWCYDGAWESKSADDYGSIFVSKYLFIDLVWARDVPTTVAPAYRHDYQANWISKVNDPISRWDGLTYIYEEWAAENNAISVGEIYAERLQIRTNQSDVKGAQSTFESIYVGTGGLYVDGNKNNNLQISSLNTASSGNVWNTSKNGSGGWFDANWSGTISFFTDEKLTYLLGEFGDNPLTYGEAVFGSANDAIWRNKLITIRSWSAPAHSTDKEDLEGGKATKRISREARQSTMSAGRTTPMPASR